MKKHRPSALLAFIALAFAGLSGSAAPSAAVPDARGDTRFLEFPLATATAAARDVEAFTWIIRQGNVTKVMFARGPKFEPLCLHTRTDEDGQSVTSVTVSPDGRFVAFVTGTAFSEGRAHNPAALIDPPMTQVWLVPAQADATARRIGNGSGPLFLNSRLAYRQERDLRTVDLSADAATDEILLPGGAAFEDVSLSPDGARLAFVHDRGGYAFLGVYRFGADRIDWLVTGADRASSPVWSPDGSRLAYLLRPGREHDKVYDRTASEPLSVHVVDVNTGEARTLWASSAAAGLALMDDPDSALRWSGADQLIFLSEHDGWARLYRLPLAGVSAVALTPAQCEVAESEQIDASELFVIHNCTDLHLRQAAIIDVSSGKQTAVATSDVVMAGAAAAANGFVAFSGGDANTAPLTRVLRVSTRRIELRERPVDHGYRATTERMPPAVVTLHAADGIEVAAQLFRPQGRGPHPALIYVHGGPQRQMFPAYHFSEYYARSYAFNRELARRGYMVLSVNFRSGVGYGRAFREATGRGWRGASEYRDVLAAAHWLAAQDDVDAKRIGIWGGSYGGLLTAQALARNSDLFAAGVSVHGVYDWSWPSARAGHLNPSGFFGVSADDRKLAFESSPLAAIDRWRSPVLLFSGDADMNVDVLETIDLAQKLKARDVPVETVLVAGEPHGFIRHATWLRLWRATSAFFDAHLQRNDPTISDALGLPMP